MVASQPRGTRYSPMLQAQERADFFEVCVLAGFWASVSLLPSPVLRVEIPDPQLPPFPVFLILSLASCLDQSEWTHLLRLKSRRRENCNDVWLQATYQTSLSQGCVVTCRQRKKQIWALSRMLEGYSNGTDLLKWPLWSVIPRSPWNKASSKHN